MYSHLFLVLIEKVKLRILERNETQILQKAQLYQTHPKQQVSFYFWGTPL